MLLYTVKNKLEQSIDLRAFGGSALTDDGLEIQKDRPAESMAVGIQVTYVPARNTILLSLAIAWAESLGGFDIFIGAEIPGHLSVTHPGSPILTVTG